MSDLMAYYDLNPMGALDQNHWDLRVAEVNWRFRENSLYTPLLDWDASGMGTGAVNTMETELLEGDVDSNPIPLTANFIEAEGIDSRWRKFSTERHGGKVQFHKSSKVFNMWKMSGAGPDSRDWKPLLRDLLGRNVVAKTEALCRNVWFKGSKDYWTYSGNRANIGAIQASDKFELDKINEWRLRLGNTGSPVILGDEANAKVCILPPGAVYDFMIQLKSATGNETALYKESLMYRGEALRYEIGTHKGVRLLEAPSNRFGINPNVLYNCGAITKQYGVIEPIHIGDGSPDPNAEAVDGVWYVGQQNSVHYVKLEAFGAGDLVKNDFVTIHVKTTDALGVTNGVVPFDGKTIVRRIVKVDANTDQIAFDRPISFNYTNAFQGKSVTGNTERGLYAYVTKGINIGFALILGSRAGVVGKVMEPIEFHDPDPVDDFKSVWRFTYDGVFGTNVAEPNAYELYFFSTSIPKPGGVA